MIRELTVAGTLLNGFVNPKRVGTRRGERAAYLLGSPARHSQNSKPGECSEPHHGDHQHEAGKIRKTQAWMCVGESTREIRAS